MHPNLLVVTGPLAGQHYALTEAETSIGRVPENGITLNDASVSRRHCLIVRRGEQYFVRDLDSHNGTFVNGVPIEEHVLESGDRIEIGDSSLLFRLTLDDIPTPPQVPESHLTKSEVRSPWALEMAALLKVTTTVVLLENLYQSRGAPAHAILERQLCELLFDIVPGDRAAVLLTEENNELDLLCGWDANTGGGYGGESGLITEALTKGEPLAAASALAVPIVVSDRAIGVVFVGSSNPARHFVDREIQVLTAIANIAGLALHHAREVEFLRAENRELRTNAGVEHDMVGESARMRRLYDMVSKVAQGGSTVLIRGESGTGKELVARAIHRNSRRAAKPFVAINCAAVTETLLESEFFGHEKGSFTGATVQKKGKLEIADGGTVFLDEIGELAPGLQAKLLRVLQEHEFERVGGTRSIKVDLRIIAATNRDLEQAIREGGFRQDLYYRLNVVALETPPLRERREDILLLAASFAQRFAKASGRHIRGLSERARACLLAYDWPGNVRELENAVERAVVLGSTDLILAEDLPDAVVEAQPAHSLAGSFHDAVRDTKKQLILNALEEAGGNFTEAARLLDLHPNYLHRLATQLQLRRK